MQCLESFWLDCKGTHKLSHMENKPNKPNNYAYMSNTGFELAEQDEGGTQIFPFEASEANALKESGNVAMPLNMVVPAGMQWSPGASSADGIISVAGKESKRDMHTPYSGAPMGSNETMLGLELGKRTYFKVPGGNTSGGTVQASGPPLPRKHRIAGQIPGCQVEGCKTDLTSAKDYHRRHKVCAIHSKAPRVIVRGEEQRFCQQCSRFHGLDAFDEGKRSCRNRLEGHNKRRRKPQPDPLGLSARFLPAFQENSRLGQLFADRSSFLPHMRIPGVSALWDDGNPAHQQKGSWQQQRMLTYDDRSAYECSIPAGAGIERQLFMGLQHHPNDRSTLFSPQSPKGMILGSSSDVGGGGPKTTHQYFQGSANPLGASLSLTSCSSGAGVLSGLEAIPVGQGFPRVSDSGRALSLQSTMQFLSSTQGMVADITTTHSNIITDQGLQSSQHHHIPTAQPLGHGGGQHHHPPPFEWAQDKLLSAASSLQSLSSSATGYQSGSMSIDKDHLEGPFAHSLNGVAGFDGVPMYSMFHGDVRLGDMSQDVKPTMDLMQVATSASHGLNTQPLVSTGSYDLGVSHFQDLQAIRSYEPSIYSSQEM